MTSIRIIEPITFMHGAPVYCEAGTLTLNTMTGLTEDWADYLWGFQKFLKRIETALTTNSVTSLLNIACSDPLAANFYPDDEVSFKNVPFSWSVATNNHNAITPLWRRYYKYQPSGSALPLYVCMEGGWKGGNSSNVPAPSRVTAHLSLSIANSFSAASGLLGNVNTHFFPTGYETTGTNNAGPLSYPGNLYFYTNGDDIYLSLLGLQSASKGGVYHILGRTSSGYSTPNEHMRGVILSKAQFFTAGVEPSYEPVCLMPPSYPFFTTTGTFVYAINFSNLLSPARFVTLSGASYCGVRTLVDECLDTIKTQGRVIAEPYTFTDLGGNYYLLPKLIRMVDIDRTIINVTETSLMLYGEVENLVMLPLMMTTLTVNSSQFNTIGATTLGLMLDDTIIDG